MAEKTITAVSIHSEGWYAIVTLAGVEPTGATYDYGISANNTVESAKMVFTVTSKGYDNTGAATTYTRTVYGTKTLRKAYPDHATLNEIDTGDDIQFYVALSDHIYADETVTVAIAAGIWTKGADSSAAFSGAVTNNSTNAYPKVIGNWAWPGFSYVAGNFDIEFVAFHKFGRYQKPVACVVFTATDQHSHTWTTTVTELSKSTRGEPQCVQIYKATVDVSGFTDGDVITVQAKAYPWIGGAGACLDTNDGVNSHPTPKYTNQLYTYKTSGHGFTRVASGGNDGTGQVYSSQSAAEAGNAYATIAAAMTALAAYHNTNAGHNDAGGGTVLLGAGTWTLNSTNGGTLSRWVTITRASGATKANAIFQAAATNSRHAKYCKLYDISWTGTNYFTGNNTDLLWIDSCTLNTTGTLSTWSTPLSYATLSSGVFARQFTTYSTSATNWGVTRGNTLTTAGYGYAYVMLGNKGVGASIPGANCWSGDGGIMAYNTLPAMSILAGSTLAMTVEFTHGLACVQNFAERITDNTQPLLQICGDVQAVPSNHIVIWGNTMAGQRSNMGYNDHYNARYLHNNWCVKGNNLNECNVKGDPFGYDATISAIADSGGLANCTVNSSAGFVVGDRFTIAGTTNYNGVHIISAKPDGTHITLTTAYSSEETGLSATGTSRNPVRTGSWPVEYGVGFYGNSFEYNTIPQTFQGIKTLLRSVYYISDRSVEAGLTGYGDYRLQSSSPSVGLVDYYNQMLPYDLYGNIRKKAGTAAGCFEEYSVIDFPATNKVATDDTVDGQDGTYAVSGGGRPEFRGSNL